MLQLCIDKRVHKFLLELPTKHRKQLSARLIELSKNPMPHDCSALIGYPQYYRIDSDEYRIIYRYNKEKIIINVILIGKRNDDAVYRQLRKLLK